MIIAFSTPEGFLSDADLVTISTYIPDWQRKYKSIFRKINNNKASENGISALSTRMLFQ